MAGSGNMRIPGWPIKSLHELGDGKLADEMFSGREQVRNRRSRKIIEGFGWNDSTLVEQQEEREERLPSGER